MKLLVGQKFSHFRPTSFLPILTPLQLMLGMLSFLNETRLPGLGQKLHQRQLLTLIKFQILPNHLLHSIPLHFPVSVLPSPPNLTAIACLLHLASRVTDCGVPRVFHDGSPFLARNAFVTRKLVDVDGAKFVNALH